MVEWSMTHSSFELGMITLLAITILFNPLWGHCSTQVISYTWRLYWLILINHMYTGGSMVFPLVFHWLRPVINFHWSFHGSPGRNARRKVCAQLVTTVAHLVIGSYTRLQGMTMFISLGLSSCWCSQHLSANHETGSIFWILLGLMWARTKSSSAAMWVTFTPLVLSYFPTTSRSQWLIRCVVDPHCVIFCEVFIAKARWGTQELQWRAQHRCKCHHLSIERSQDDSVLPTWLQWCAFVRGQRAGGTWGLRVHKLSTKPFLFLLSETFFEPLHQLHLLTSFIAQHFSTSSVSTWRHTEDCLVPNHPPL